LDARNTEIKTTAETVTMTNAGAMSQSDLELEDAIVNTCTGFSVALLHTRSPVYSHRAAYTKRHADQCVGDV
jgi:hypothetical protein